MVAEMIRLPLPEPDDSHPLDWYPEDSEQIGLPGTLTETSYTLPEDLNIGQWLAIGQTLQQMERSIGWWLGDWWNYGKRRYGDMASQASRDHIKDATGHTYHTVRQAGLVAKRFEIDDRSSDVSWTHHLVVSDLPKEEAKTLLKEAAAEGLTKRETLERAQDRKKVIEAEAIRARPAPLVLPASIHCLVADARAMPLASESVDLIVTSPPYGIDIAYEGGDVSPEAWPAFMHHWLLEAWRVSKWHGRLALNVPLDTSEPYQRPTYAESVQAALEAGWLYQATLTWDEGNTTTGNRSLGSVNSSARPHPVDSSEMIVLFSKGEWGPSSSNPDDIDGREWQEAGRGPWRFSGESRAWEGHPAPYPVELPRRLIKYLCRRGDTVLDPFCGSGTTLVAALEAGREAIGLDVSEAYVRSALRRVAR